MYTWLALQNGIQMHRSALAFLQRSATYRRVEQEQFKMETTFLVAKNHGRDLTSVSRVCLNYLRGSQSSPPLIETKVDLIT